MHRFQKEGPYQWFAAPDLKIHFFRPLASLAISIDYWVFGKAPFWKHVHSGLWYLLLVMGAAWVYRRALPGGAWALLAAVVFVFDEGHWTPAAWLANRNALMGAAPVALGLAAHLRWRETGWRPGLPLSLVGYGAGLLSGEMAVAVLAYLPAYELAGTQGRWSTRLRAVAPGAVLVVLYLALYTFSGYGVRGSGVYLDPLQDPLVYLAKAPGRFAVLAGTQFLSVPAELTVFAPATYGPFVVAGLVALGVVAGVLWRLWPGLAPAPRRAIRWLGLGAALSALPALATFPAGRLLLAPSLGACAIIALILIEAWRRRERFLVLLHPTAAVFVVLHLIAAPLSWWVMSSLPVQLDERMREVHAAVPVADTHAPERRYIILWAPDPVAGMYPPLVRATQGHPIPLAWRVLSVAECDHRVTRTGPKRFELALIDGQMLMTVFERLWRDQERPLEQGEVVRLGDMAITVLAAGDTGPTRIEVTTQAPLDDPPYVYLVWRDGGLRRFTFPPVSESVTIPYEPGFFNLDFVRGRDVDKE